MQYKYIVLSNTTLGVFMGFLDSNIVLISLPTIIRDLPGTNAFDAIWFVMAYVLITATALLAFGRLADIYGRVRLYNSDSCYSRLVPRFAAQPRTAQHLCYFA